jgi:signal transduction histidine kinase/CheY-like chemotaxis protein
MRARMGLYFLIAVLIPLGLGTLVSERLIERHINGLVRRAASDRMDMVVGRLRDKGRFLRSEVLQIAGSPALVRAEAAGELGDLAEVLRSERASRHLDFLWAVRADGKLLWPERQIQIPAALVAKALVGSAAVSYEEIDRGLVRAPPRREPGETLLAMVAAVPVGGNGGQGHVGALLGGVLLTGNDALPAELIDHGSSSVVIAHRGVVVASSLGDDEGTSSQGLAAGSRLPAAQERAAERGEAWSGEAGPARFATLAPLVDARGQPVGAVLVQMSTARFASLRADARGSYLVAMFVGTLISLLLALLATRQITGPLRRLAHAASSMEKGRLDIPVPVEGNDEVAQLAITFKRMAGALSESMSTLESRVRERTAELVEARDRASALNRDLTAQNERLLTQGEQLRAQGEVLEEQRRELEEKTRRSEEADRLKSAFIANMSHEIRTPLNSVLALSQLLRDGMAGPLTNDQRNYLEVIERNGQGLLRLINDILDLSRIEAGHLEMDVRSVELEPVVRAAVSALAPLGEAKGLEVQVKVPPGLPPVRCDVDRVQQVLTNLVGNAIKFTEVGTVMVTAEEQGQAVAIVVTDTGVGIPQALTGKIFQEFFQVDQTLARRQGGTGLGLAIASRLAHLMGGDIKVQSLVGHGSRFTLTLPQAGLADEEEAEAAEAEDVSTPLEGTVLVVDDDGKDRLAAAALLEGTGLAVVEAGSGDEAMRLLAERRFDAVVLDLFMTGLNGFDVLGEVRQDPRLAQVPFIVLTAHDLTSGDRESLSGSVFGFVRKGESMRAGLAATVRKAVKMRGRPSPAPAPPRSATILIVEDNEDNLFTLRQILNRVAVDVAAVAGGREAIEYCRRRRPDLIIMDVQMPGMSGLQATGAIRALPGGAAIPIVALTAQAMKGDRERILAAGCDEYLAKPVQPNEMLAVVERLLGARRPEATSRSTAEKGGTGQHGTHTPRR